MTHRKAFELLQRSMDGPLDSGERAELDRHMATCAECQTVAALQGRLEKEAPMYRPPTVPSQEEIEKTIRNTQKHHRRRHMLKQLSSPIRAVASAGVAVALVLAVIWIFDIVPREADPAEVTGVEKETVVETVVVSYAQDFDAEAEQEILESITDEIIKANFDYEPEVLRKYHHEDYEYFADVPGWVGRVSYNTMISSFRKGGTEMAIDNAKWFVTPSMAVMTCDFHVASPQRPSGDILLTRVFQKIDGQWYIVHEAYTAYRALR